MIRAVVGALAVLALVAPAAGAVTLMVNGDTPAVRFQRWVDAVPFETPDITVDVIVGATAGYPLPAGCVRSCAIEDGPAGRPAIWTPPTDIFGDPRTSADLRASIVHEAVAHVIDYEWMNDALRREAMALVGEQRPWRSPPNSPHERFATLAETCALGPRYVARQVRERIGPLVILGYGLELRPARLAKGCSFVASLAHRL